MAKSQFGKWLDKSFNIGHAMRDDRGFGAILNKVQKIFDENIDDLIKKTTDSGMTTGEEERMDKQLANQQILNEDEYQRKIEFYEDYESPEAQVRQYKSAGLNPALMFGNGASVSASGGIGSPGSAASASPSGGAGLFDVLQGILSIKKFDIEKKLAEADILKKQTETDAQRIENKWNERLKEIHAREVEQKIALYGQQGAVYDATVKKMAEETKYQSILVQYAPGLMEASIGKDEAAAALSRSNIELNDKQKANLDEVMKNHQKERQLMDAKIAECSEHVYQMSTQADLNTALAEKAWHEVSKISKEIELIGEQIGLTKKDVEYYVWNHSRTSGAFGLKWNTSSENGRTTKRENSINDMVFLLRQAGYTVEEPKK